jgi:hypothetical protein
VKHTQLLLSIEILNYGLKFLRDAVLFIEKPLGGDMNTQKLISAVLHMKLGTEPLDSVNLTKMGYLYFIASVFQTGWLYILYIYRDIAVQYAQIPPIGWALVLIWTALTLSIPYLMYVSYKLITFTKNADTYILQTKGDVTKQYNISALLIIGIIVDLILFPTLQYIDDKSLVVFIVGAMGGRVVQANIEAIIQYFSS